jgi:15-cis-phytoene synthase
MSRFGFAGGKMRSGGTGTVELEPLNWNRINRDAALTDGAANLTLDEAYGACREIARREAKNFYYAFVALPLGRRNAICAIYAFMRQADDLSDDESVARDERRRRLSAWLEEWHAVCRGADSANPAFVAARDATRRFAIPLRLLDELVAGVAMDLDCAATGAPDTYATFGDLYRYCYLVASVVGLVSIHIFGYADHRAEKLAEETGIAFQLTNILRDVAEDASRNRVYLAEEDLAGHGLSVQSILNHKLGAAPGIAERAMLAEYARRAENYYQSAETLLPLIDRESRPALWVLVSIYHALLKRIERANYDVFSRRISVPLPKKLAILCVGLARMIGERVSVRGRGRVNG